MPPVAALSRRVIRAGPHKVFSAHQVPITIPATICWALVIRRHGVVKASLGGGLDTRHHSALADYYDAISEEVAEPYTTGCQALRTLLLILALIPKGKAVLEIPPQHLPYRVLSLEFRQSIQHVSPFLAQHERQRNQECEPEQAVQDGSQILVHYGPMSQQAHDEGLAPLCHGLHECSISIISKRTIASAAMPSIPSTAQALSSSFISHHEAGPRGRPVWVCVFTVLAPHGGWLVEGDQPGVP